MAKLNDVNAIDIVDAIQMACKTMSSVFNADDNDIPFFESKVLPEAYLSFNAVHSESHVPGRHLNALLNAEDAVGIALDENAIEKHASAAFFSYSGPVALPLNRNRADGPLANFAPHNCREGFHALYALARYRGSVRAQELAAASIDAISTYWHPDNGWDCEYLEGELNLEIKDSTFIIGLGRSIGPLVKYFRATSHAPALDLAIVLKEKALEFFGVDGSYDREAFGSHTHSTTCVMSSLAQLADLTSDAELMNRVRSFYDNGLWEIRDMVGWVIENSDDDADTDMGEINNSGDIVETALILGKHGYPEYYEDAERILRCHILPSQLRDVSFIPDPPNPEGKDGKRDVAARHQGGLGFPAPYGHKSLDRETVSFNMDIVGGGTASLCEAVRAITHSDEAGHWVNLLFDHESAAIEVQSPYTHPALTVAVKQPGPLFVRLPGWIDHDELRVKGAPKPFRFTNGYLMIPTPRLDHPITFEFPLAHREIMLEHRTRKIGVQLLGDSVSAMDNFGADLTFFDPIQR